MHPIMAATMLLAACADEQRPPGDADSDTSSSPTDVAGALEAAGFRLAAGHHGFATLERCCDTDAYCWGNNPSTPYGMHALPPSDGEASPDDILADLATPPAGMSQTFRLRHDEAIVHLGTLPPEAAYLGYRAYLADRAGSSFPVVGALGPALNHLVFAAGLGGEPWGQDFALITSLDAGVEDDIRAALEAAGVAPHSIFSDRMPGDLVRPGLDADADSFMTLMRVAVYDDPEQGATWQSDSAPEVWRVTPTVPRAWDAPHAREALPPLGTGTDEEALRGALDDMSEALTTHFADRGSVLAPTLPLLPETYGCIEAGASCAGNLHDRWAAVSPSFMIESGELVVAFGVNHAAQGKASYSSISLQTVLTQTGLVSFTNSEMVGSADAWLPGHADGDAIYAVTFARDCEGLPGVCREVHDDCEAAGEAQELKLTARAYLEPATGAAPLYTELLVDRVIKFGAAP